MHKHYTCTSISQTHHRPTYSQISDSVSTTPHMQCQSVDILTTYCAQPPCRKPLVPSMGSRTCTRGTHRRAVSAPHQGKELCQVLPQVPVLLLPTSDYCCCQGLNSKNYGPRTSIVQEPLGMPRGSCAPSTVLLRPLYQAQRTLGCTGAELRTQYKGAEPAPWESSVVGAPRARKTLSSSTRWLTCADAKALTSPVMRPRSAPPSAARPEVSSSPTKGRPGNRHSSSGTLRVR